MLRWIVAAINVLSIFFAWITLLLSVLPIVRLIQKLCSHHRPRLFEVLVALLCGLYSILFLVGIIFFYGLWETFAGTSFLILLVVSRAYSRFEYWKAYGRWWQYE